MRTLEQLAAWVLFSTALVVVYGAVAMTLL